jgi:hypothetical protein
VIEVLIVILVVTFFLLSSFLIFNIIRLGLQIYRMSSSTVRNIFPIALFLIPSLLPESALQIRKRFMRYFIYGVFLNLFIIAISVAMKL